MASPLRAPQGRCNQARCDCLTEINRGAKVSTRNLNRAALGMPMQRIYFLPFMRAIINSVEWLFPRRSLMDLTASESQ